MRVFREQLTEELKKNWLSNYQMQQICKSSSADRVARFIKNDPPENFHWEQRRKDCPTYCLEYRLVFDGNE